LQNNTARTRSAESKAVLEDLVFIPVGLFYLVTMVGESQHLESVYFRALSESPTAPSILHVAAVNS
jgi:hypothetical protein